MRGSYVGWAGSLASMLVSVLGFSLLSEQVDASDFKGDFLCVLAKLFQRRKPNEQLSYLDAQI